MQSLCHELKNEVRQLNNDLISISTVSANPDELEASFMHFQLLKENLLKMESDHDMEIQQLLTYCRPQCKESMT